MYPAIKAMQFNNRTTVVRTLCSPDAFQNALAAMLPETRWLVERPLPATDWIPLELNDDFLKRMRSVAYGGDLSRVFEQGRKVQLAGARGVYKAFIRILDTQHVIAIGARYYQTVFRNNGTLRVEKQDSKHVVVHYENVTMPSEEFYEAQRGSLQGICEATRSPGVKIDYLSGGGTQSHCSFMATLSVSDTRHEPMAAY